MTYKTSTVGRQKLVRLQNVQGRTGRHSKDELEKAWQLISEGPCETNEYSSTASYMSEDMGE